MHTDQPTTSRWLTGSAITAIAALLLALAASPVAAGPPPDRLAAAGWTCFEHLDAWHCGPQVDDLFAGAEPGTVMLMTWALEPSGEPGEFWGTELLIHADLYRGQPCPQDPLASNGGQSGAYIDVADLGVPLPYFVCHHFDSPNT